MNACHPGILFEVSKLQNSISSMPGALTFWKVTLVESLANSIWFRNFLSGWSARSHVRAGRQLSTDGQRSFGASIFVNLKKFWIKTKSFEIQCELEN